MKDNAKPCQHSLNGDVIYKEVVIIGNGPSGMVTSFMLAGNVPYLKQIPDDLPIDEMLKARLSNLPPGQSLYEADLMELAEGLEGRCENPIPLLMDNLLRPCADMGIHADSLIEWRFEEDKQIEHIVLGRGAPGGAWQSFPAGVRTLSPGAWLTLPPHADAGAGRLSARAVANYCRRYVHACKLQPYFRSGVVVTDVSRAPRCPEPPSPEPPCAAPNCPSGAKYYVTARECGGGTTVYACARVVLAAGGADRANTLRHVTHATYHLAGFERALHSLHVDTNSPPSVLIIGSGVSAADAVIVSRGAGARVRHVHRAPAEALARLDPQPYPDYCHVYKMMCDGPQAEHPNYTPYPEHAVMEVTPLDSPGPYTLQPKRVTLLNLKTNQTTEITVSLIGVFIGSKPDLFFLKNDCSCEKINKRKLEAKQCSLKNHWTYIKSVLGQSIQSCKSRYLNYTEMNGNETKCFDDCNKTECQCKLIPYFDKCQCDNPSDGVGFGVNEFKPVECRTNPVAVDKRTHELVKMSGVYALGPLTGDNFVRFIPGGALALVSHIRNAKSH